jgi:hypothetical protein
LTASGNGRPLSSIAIILVILILFWTQDVTQAQSTTSFTLKDEFSIPSSNGVINFAVNGTYARALLVNGTWSFDNLHLSNSQPLDKLMVTAQSSNVTIISYQRFNTTVGSARLSYVVEGEGTQTFNIGLDPKKGEWSLVFNGEFVSEGDGWSASPEGTITVTGATSNVTIYYFGFPDSITGNENQPFYQQHSVAITVAVVLAITVTVALAIRKRSRKHLSKPELITSKMSFNTRFTVTKLKVAH